MGSVEWTDWFKQVELFGRSTSLVLGGVGADNKETDMAEFLESAAGTKGAYLAAEGTTLRPGEAYEQDFWFGHGGRWQIANGWQPGQRVVKGLRACMKTHESRGVMRGGGVGFVSWRYKPTLPRWVRSLRNPASGGGGA